MKTVLTRKLSWASWPLSTTTIRTYSFVTECFGPVATATSK